MDLCPLVYLWLAKVDAMISARFFWVCFLGIFSVYLAGLFATLMENDSAQFAVMAQRMVLENDFLNLWKGTEEYLDKPHMHYWLAAISFKVFGMYDWAYRIPALLLILLGAYSCYGIGRLYYGKSSGRMAALIFLSAQTIVLSGIDVRTDAVLTGFAAFSLWQLLRYLENKKTSGLLLGAFAAGLAFSTKGQIALVVIGLPLFIQLLYTRRWQRLWDFRVLLALAVFVLAVSPMLYAYYQQFDMHPEKMIRGRANRSGILFIFWEQSFERLSGEGVGANSSDYFFFFHTFLWVFLPWTIVGLAGFGNSIGKCWAKLFRGKGTIPEIGIVGGAALIFLLISFAQFKLPHYLNITIPLFSVLTAAYLDKLAKSDKALLLRRFARAQGGILILVLSASAGILFWVFPIPLPFAAGIILLGTGLGIWLSLRIEGPLKRLIALTVWASVFLNLVLNAHFYPRLLEYQAGSEIARQLPALAPEASPIYKLGKGHTWAMDFYTMQPLIETQVKHLKQDGVEWLYASEKQLKQLREKDISLDTILAADQFRITRLQARFLNPEHRGEVLRKRFLVRLKPLP